MNYIHITQITTKEEMTQLTTSPEGMYDMEMTFNIGDNGPIHDATHDTLPAPLYNNSNDPSESSTLNIRSPITSSYDNSTIIESPPYNTIDARMMTYPNVTISGESPSQSVYSPKIPITDITRVESAEEIQYFPPERISCFVVPSSSILPPKPEMLTNFENWMASMDGGCHTDEICMKAKLVVKNILDVVETNEIMDSDIICKYFTDKQLRKELTASSTSVCIGYYSNYLLYMRERYSTLYSLDKYSSIARRIE